MSNQTRRPPASRAEARRRARQQERGEEADYSEGEEPSTEASTRPSGPAGLFGRLFPPAAPLPGKPDPLAGFTYSGPFRGVVAALYVLALNPRGWLLPGIAWAVAQTVSTINLWIAVAYSNQFKGAPPSYGLLEIVGLLGTVFAVVSAGWIGWQRPWLFGLSASIAGTLIQATILGVLIDPVPVANATFGSVFVAITLNQILQLQWALGALIGWYGGYLRRRMTVTAPAARQGRQRRR
ncbi:MAG TPA: hypothetical protein VIH33_01245 [Candidatus Limnocylindria bacterium]